MMNLSLYSSVIQLNQILYCCTIWICFYLKTEGETQDIACWSFNLLKFCLTEFHLECTSVHSLPIYSCVQSGYLLYGLSAVCVCPCARSDC